MSKYNTAEVGPLQISTTDTMPQTVTLTGTIASSGLTVTGTGTAFLTEIIDTAINRVVLKYKWLYDPSQEEIREIAHVNSNTILVLKQAFTLDVTGGTAVLVPDTYTYDYKEISVTFVGAGGKINGLTIPAGMTQTYSNKGGFTKPIIVDGSSEQAEIVFKL